MMIRRVVYIFVLLAIVEFRFGQTIRCYEHEYCLNGCPDLRSTVVQCSANSEKCWKMNSPLGVKRGCGDNRCAVQVDVGLVNTASVCCSGDLCNSASSSTRNVLLIAVLGVVSYLYREIF